MTNLELAVEIIEDLLKMHRKDCNCGDPNVSCVWEIDRADRFVAIKGKVNNQDPLGEALNSGDGSYKP